MYQQDQNAEEEAPQAHDIQQIQVQARASFDGKVELIPKAVDGYGQVSLFEKLVQL